MRRPAFGSLLTALVILFAVVLSGACGSSAAPRRTAADARSNPCALLNSAQLRQLRFSPGKQAQSNDELGGVACVWTGYPLASGPSYTARVVVGAVPGGTPASSINNRRTVQYTPPGVDPRTHCGYLVSVESGHTLAVQFADDHGSLPGLNHQVACRKAQAAAVDMTSTIGALQS